MKILQHVAVVLLASTLFYACGSQESGQMSGAKNRPSWKPINPYGMVYVPAGTLHIGPSDQDINYSLVQRPKAISIQGFYMDDTEITNNEYRQFVEWVRDSIAHETMGHTETWDNGDNHIDWEQELDYNDQTLDGMYYAANERFDNKRELDTRKLEFEYQWKDWQQAAKEYRWKDKNSGNNRTKIIKKEKVLIYPDTLCWVRDFSYSYNEPMTRNYFWHPAFDDYPVVGVAWKQANAFCYWRTKFWNMYRGPMGEVNSEEFRLPFEHEWEYAARGGHDMAPFPWGGYYVRNAKGCILANFKPGRGNYPEDGGYYTVKSDAYFPNDYGLYCMAGNVAEWTISSYERNSYSFIHDQNPDVRYDAQESDPEAWKRKVIRGGSWKDVAFFLQNGSRQWEYEDTTKSYIGFRCALTFLGRSMNDFK